MAVAIPGRNETKSRSGAQFEKHILILSITVNGYSTGANLKNRGRFGPCFLFEIDDFFLIEFHVIGLSIRCLPIISIRIGRKSIWWDRHFRLRINNIMLGSLDLTHGQQLSLITGDLTLSHHTFTSVHSTLMRRPR